MKYFLNCFKLLCIITASIMVGYWIYKYSSNEDISIIEYKSFKEFDSLSLPAMSICISKPFLIKNGTLDNNRNVKIESYLKYLRGDNGLYQNYQNVSYEQVSIDILDYLDVIKVYQKLSDKQIGWNFTCSNPNDCPFVRFKNNFNGFFDDSLFKCFEMKVKIQYSKSVRFVILEIKKKFEDVVRQSKGIFVRFSYPGQLLLDFTADQLLWRNRNITKTFTTFKLASIEMLQRRNKRNKICLSNSKSYDDLKQKDIIEKVGCKAPYHNLNIDTPICKDSTKLAKFDGVDMERGNFPPPCEEIPQVSFKSLKIWTGDKFGYYPLHIGYPKSMKLIRQQQAIDIHALIGNIGGYIGLFLGKFRNCRINENIF